MHEITLTFNTEDAGLNLTGTVNFPDAKVPANGLPDSLYVRGLAEWRHAPANIVHVNENTINRFNMPERGKPLSKIGINWIGIKAHSDILISFATRTGKNGTAKVQEQLTKFFKAIGASSVKFSVLDVEAELSNQEAPDSGNDSAD
jgi:hypothetical protein